MRTPPITRPSDQDRGAPADGSLEFLRVLRDQRFALGVYCPRCGGRRVQGWGRFLGRQRYKCRNCARTFSDLTHTPFAYSKRLAQWPVYMRCAETAETVRRSAVITGLHCSTAFRWRHLLLDYVREGEQIRFRDTVELRVTKHLYSNKGQNQRASRDMRGANVAILWVADSNGANAGEVYLKWDFNAQDYARLLLPRLARGCRIVSIGGRLGNVALFCRRAGLEWVGIPRTHSSPLSRHMNHFFHWLKRFRGVATSYLDNYLAWHRMIAANLGLRLLRRWLTAALSPPTLPANTAP